LVLEVISDCRKIVVLVTLLNNLASVTFQILSMTCLIDRLVFISKYLDNIKAVKQISMCDLTA
jgi:hypothetical protein